MVTGGGTGGHVYPAIAVADELVRRGRSRAAVHFLGSARGLEARAVPAAGYGIDLLPGRGLQRSIRPSALLANLRTAGSTARAFARALHLLRGWRPAVVLGVGGYAAAPGVLAARLLGIPVVVHEQNAAPGLVNRVAVALGARAATSLPGTALRGAVLTGNPVRSEIAAEHLREGGAGGSAPREPAGATPWVGVFGGSLGARRINDATLDLVQRWRERRVVIHHVSGRRDYQRCLGERDRPAVMGVRAGEPATGAAEGRVERDDDGIVYELVEYEDHMPELYARADVVVARAGAVTVAELAVSGTPAVLVPLPGAPSDHQTANANALVAAGAAVIVPDAECDGARLASELDVLLGDPVRLEAMGTAARGLARPDAAARVADLVEEAARGR